MNTCCPRCRCPPYRSPRGLRNSPGNHPTGGDKTSIITFFDVFFFFFFTINQTFFLSFFIDTNSVSITVLPLAYIEDLRKEHLVNREHFIINYHIVMFAYMYDFL